MFKINESVIHCREGLSTILSLSSINGKDYFIVRTHQGQANGETIYVPVETASSIIRPILNEKEADGVLKFIKSIKKEFNTNTKQRRDSYKKRLGSGNVEDIAYLYRQLYFYNKIGGENNTEIKLGPVDIDMLSYAKNMLLDELAISYKVEREDVEEYIEKRIKKL
jgi:RNA polymerase-interacting CarD/CdnL/TRCF family regulator